MRIARGPRHPRQALPRGGARETAKAELDRLLEGRQASVPSLAGIGTVGGNKHLVDGVKDAAVSRHDIGLNNIRGIDPHVGGVRAIDHHGCSLDGLHRPFGASDLVGRHLSIDQMIFENLLEPVGARVTRSGHLCKQIRR